MEEPNLSLFLKYFYFNWKLFSESFRLFMTRKNEWNSTIELLQYRESGFKGPVAKIKFQELDRQAIKGLVDQIM